MLALLQVCVGMELHQNMFAFDKIYAFGKENAEDRDHMYAWHVKPMVDGLFEGINGCVFAYGITGAGGHQGLYGRPVLACWYFVALCCVGGMG